MEKINITATRVYSESLNHSFLWIFRIRNIPSRHIFQGTMSSTFSLRGAFLFLLGSLGVSSFPSAAFFQVEALRGVRTAPGNIWEVPFEKPPNDRVWK